MSFDEQPDPLSDCYEACERLKKERDEAMALADSRLATADQLTALVERYKGKLDEVTRERDEVAAKLRDKLEGVGYLCLIHKSEACHGCASDLKKAESQNAALRAKAERGKVLFREVLRWRDAEENDGFPHDTRLSIIEWLEAIAAESEPEDRPEPKYHFIEGDEKKPGAEAGS